MSRWIVQNVPAWWLVGLAVVGVPALAVLIQWLLRRQAPSLASGEHNDAVGFLGATAGVVYAIIVGFMVITLWENYVAAGDSVQNETVSLSDLVQFSGAFGPAAQKEIRQLVVQYGKSVTTTEWQAMAKGDASPEAQKDFDQLITAVQSLRVHDPAQQEVLGAMLTQVDEAGRERQQRLELSGPQIPAPMWLAVILTSVVTLVFCLLFDVKSAWLRYFMMAAVAAVISATLVLALLLEYPFSGTIEVSPAPFEHVAGELR
jgi:Na+/melibiose symporter-like transporter